MLLALAIIKNGIADRSGLNQALREVAGPPGTKIYPLEWKKARELIMQDQDIDYQGLSGSNDFIDGGNVSNPLLEILVKDNNFIDGPFLK